MLKNVGRGIVLCVGLLFSLLGVITDNTILTFLGFVTLLFGAPFCAIGFFVVLLVILSYWPNWLSDDNAKNMFAFELVGFAWVLAKICFTTIRVRRERREEEELRKENNEWEDREREEIRFENKEILSSISELVSSCGAAANEVTLVAKAMGGRDTEDIVPKLVVLHDIARILVSFRDTDSPGDVYIGRLWEGVGNLLNEDCDFDIRPLSLIENNGVNQPEMVNLLTHYDKLQNAHFASKAASTYLSIVSTIADHCKGSLAAKLVADAYTTLLMPYVNEGKGEGNTGRSNTSSNGNSSKGSYCEKCADGFRLLGLTYGASQDEVESQRRTFAQLLHSDRLGAMSDKVRLAGEEQLKSINVACDHILQCDGSESRQKTRQENTPQSNSNPSQEEIEVLNKKVREATKRMENLIEAMQRKMENH